MIGRAAKDIIIKIKADDKDFQKGIRDSDKSMGAFAQKMKAYGPAMAVGFAVAAAAVVGLAVKMAAAEEVVNRQTESMLKSQGILWESVKGELTDYINELERLTAYGDTDLQLAFNRMSSSGMSYNATLESMKMVTDIAYTRNMDLVSAADLVAKAYNGQGSSLKRYGIVIEDGITGLDALNAVQEQVNKNFADASDRTETLEGKMGLLTTATDDFMEALGDPMTGPLADFVDVLAEGTSEADGMATSLGKLGAGAIEGWMMPKDLMMSLRLELQKLDALESRTFEENKRRNTILFEMQHGSYRSRKALTEELQSVEENIRWESESYYFTQLRKLGSTNEHINSLKAQLNVEKEITQEAEKQLSLADRKAAFEGRPLSAKQRSASAALSRSPLGPVGETRQSGQWTIGPSVAATKSGL